MNQMAFDKTKITENEKMNEKTMIDDLTVRKYLPYQEKIEFAAEVIRCALETDNETNLSFMSFREDLFIVYFVMKYYTDFPVNDDPVGTYDYVTSTGLYDTVHDYISTDIKHTLDLYYRMKASALEVARFKVSADHLLSKVMSFVEGDEFVAAITNMRLEAEQLGQNLNTIKQAPNLLNFAKK